MQAGREVEVRNSTVMSHHLEKEVVLPKVTVQLLSLAWEGVGASPDDRSYALFQRLSENHSPLRIGKLSAPDVLPRVRSVGFLPAGSSVRLFPIEKPLRVICCFYDTGFVESTTKITKEQWERHADSLIALKNQRLEILMQEIYAEIEQPGFAQEFLLESVANLMLVELARHVRELDTEKSKRSDGLGLAAWQLRRIEERIQASLEMGSYPTLAELAALCGVSQGHLARSFKASTGWQVHKYMAGVRIETAKAMLAHGRSSCEEVSARLGFKTQGYFSTAFRRMTGKTPPQFRRETLGRPLGDRQ